MSRTIVVGDIHGCYQELIALLEKAGLTADDRVIAVGDLVVKGPKNRQVLDMFRHDVRFSSVIGNHDLSLVRFWRGEVASLNSAQTRAYEELKSKREYFHYLDSLPFKIDLGRHLVVHAGIRPGIPLGAQSIEDLTELRTLGPDRTSKKGVAWYEVYEGDKVVLFGHWPASEPRRNKHAIGLDTGCVYGYALTAYIVETGELISVNAERAYLA